MRVGYFSPLPPARTGVADYAATLLTALRRFGTVEVDAGHSDVALYHLGNNQIHREIYNQALARPGVVVLHDAVLHHFFLGSLSVNQYADEFCFNYGEWQRTLAVELWRHRAVSALDSRFFEYPMLKRIVEASRAVIVHNPAAAAMVRAHAPASRISEIPHFFAPPEYPDDFDAMRFRERYGIAPGDFVFGVFGYLRESKRLLAVLRCFRKAHAILPNTRLMIAGDFVSTDLARATALLLSDPSIVRIPHLPDREFWSAANAVDCCLNLRFPNAGETSGIAVRLMGLGKPVFVSESLETSAFAPGACIGIASGLAEEADLFDHMILAARFPAISREVGRLARLHIRLHHDLGIVAEKYWKTLCDSCG